MLGYKPGRLLLPLTAIIGVTLFLLVLKGKPAPEAAPLMAAALPMVDIEEAHLSRQQLWIEAQGVVEPAVRINLVSQVAGRVEWVSEQFANGGRFKAGDVLVRIEPADYEIALSQARSQLANARQVLAQEKGAARQAKREWRDLGSSEANDLFLRKPQLQSAEAGVEAAEAGLRKAELDLRRTQISAPFDGRVLNKQVDRGQFVTLGTQLGEVFADSKAEIRVAVSMSERYQLGDPVGAEVTLYSDASGVHHEWTGRVVRVESAVDTTSRQFYLVVEVDDPFQTSTGAISDSSGTGPDRNSPPLVVGQFLQARVPGVYADNTLRIPRRALRLPSHIWLLDGDDKLQVVEVQVLHRDSSTAVVRTTENNRLPVGSQGASYEDGPVRVVVSDLALAVSGMQTRVSNTHQKAI